LLGSRQVSSRESRQKRNEIKQQNGAENDQQKRRNVVALHPDPEQAVVEICRNLSTRQKRRNGEAGRIPSSRYPGRGRTVFGIR